MALIELPFIPDERDANTLCYLMGQALCGIQLLEDAISHSIALKKDVKKPHSISKEKANARVAEYRSYVLGKAIAIAKANNLYPDSLQNDLKDFLSDRNWLVHKCVPYHMDDMQTAAGKEKLFNRVQAITHKSMMLRRAIEGDMMKFSETVGLDMTHVRAAIEIMFSAKN